MEPFEGRLAGGDYFFSLHSQTCSWTPLFFYFISSQESFLLEAEHGFKSDMFCVSVCMAMCV